MTFKVLADNTSPMERRRLHVELTGLAQTYAIRVRELSDAAATLGRRIAAGEQIGESTKEVKRLKTLVEQAGEELFAALESLA